MPHQRIVGQCFVLRVTRIEVGLDVSLNSRMDDQLASRRGAAAPAIEFNRGGSTKRRYNGVLADNSRGRARVNARGRPKASLNASRSCMGVFNDGYYP